MREIIEEVNKAVCLLKDVKGLLTEFLSVADKRMERHYFDGYETSERLKALEEHLKVEYRERLYKQAKRYKKINGR